MKTIHGKRIYNNNETSSITEHLSKYYRREDIRMTVAPDVHRDLHYIEPGKVYLLSGIRSLKMPTPRIKQRVVIDVGDNRYYFRQSRYYTVTRDELASMSCVGLKFSRMGTNYRGESSLSVHTYYTAFYFIPIKTLVFSRYVELPDIIAIMGTLESHGYLTKFPETSMPIVEAPIVASIGCDPEFEVVWNAVPVRPPQSYRSYSNAIGMDGAGSQIELRPPASTDVNVVVNNLKGLMGRLQDPISTIGDAAALGGHIHVGVGYAIAPTSEMLFLLDYFLGNPTLQLSGTARTGYKKAGMYECKDWGFEYRTPPAAIFYHPDFTRLSFMIAKSITEKYMNCSTFNLNGDSPTKDEYKEYCGFTDDDFAGWKFWIKTYHKMLRNRNMAYAVNVANNWTPCQRSTIHTTPYGCEKLLDATKRWAGMENNNLLKQYMIGEPKPTRESLFGNPIIDASLDEINREQEAIEASYRILHAHNVNLSDDWSAEQIAVVASLLQVHLPNERYISTVTLFGLRSERGLVVSGFDFDGVDRIQHEHYNDSHFYGLPIMWRITDDINSGNLASAVVTIIGLEHELNNVQPQPEE